MNGAITTFTIAPPTRYVMRLCTPIILLLADSLPRISLRPLLPDFQDTFSGIFWPVATWDGVAVCLSSAATCIVHFIAYTYFVVWLVMWPAHLMLDRGWSMEPLMCLI